MSADLIQYLPDVIKPILEFQWLTYAENPEFDFTVEATDTIMQASFPAIADEKGISRWEKMLGITVQSERTLEERRFAVEAKIAESRPYTKKAIKRVLEKMTGGSENYSFTVDFDNYKVIVRIALISKFALEDVRAYLERVVPANMLIDVDLMYNQHKTLRPYTHRHLGAYTQKALRDEVLS